MKTKKLIEQLERYRAWRNDDYGDVEQPNPFELTETIDAAIVALKKILADEK